MAAIVKDDENEKLVDIDDDEEEEKDEEKGIVKDEWNYPQPPPYSIVSNEDKNSQTVVTQQATSSVRYWFIFTLAKNKQMKRCFRFKTFLLLQTTMISTRLNKLLDKNNNHHKKGMPWLNVALNFWLV